MKISQSGFYLYLLFRTISVQYVFVCMICLGSKNVPCNPGPSNYDSSEDQSSTNKDVGEPKKKGLKRIYVYRGESKYSSEKVEGNFFLL